MIGPSVLLLVSLGGVIAAAVLPAVQDLVLVAGPSAVASLYLLLRAWLARKRTARTAAARWIVIDGSNVMHWKDATPRLETLREVVTHLEDLGLVPGVVFDANAGYLISGRYQHDHALGRMLGIPADRVLVVDRGTPADPTILAAARSLGARVVTNDRYRDWAGQHPEVATPGFLIRGGYREGRLWLDLEGGDRQTAAVAAPV